MKAMVRRLSKLEQCFRPLVNEKGDTIADVIRARRRRRIEAVGLPFQETPRENFTDLKSCAASSAAGIAPLNEIATKYPETKNLQRTQSSPTVVIAFPENNPASAHIHPEAGSSLRA